MSPVAKALDGLGWWPDRAEAGAAYWAAKGEWDKCVKIGAPAVLPLIAAFEDQGVRRYRYAIEALIHIDAPAVEPLGAAFRDGDHGSHRSNRDASRIDWSAEPGSRKNGESGAHLRRNRGSGRRRGGPAHQGDRGSGIARRAR
jgi:hypothetical protein